MIVQSKSLMVCCYDGFECNSAKEMIEHSKLEHQNISQVCLIHPDKNLVRLLNGDIICPKCFAEEESIKLGLARAWKSYPSIDAFIKSLNSKKP